MKVLLDTHVALWWLQGDDLDAAAAAAIAEPTNHVLAIVTRDHRFGDYDVVTLRA